MPLSLSERTGGPADFADRLFGEPPSLLASRESSWTRDAYLARTVDDHDPQPRDQVTEVLLTRQYTKL